MSLPCAICGDPIPWSSPCAATHPDHCHACVEANLRGGDDRRDHPAPREPVVLSPRDLAALVAYQQQVQRTVGTGPLLGLVTSEDGTP